MVNQQQQGNFKLAQNQIAEEALQETKKCISCGNSTLANADICEHCHKWQLDGQCCFCYAQVRQGQMFCGSCGNTPGGKPCPNCGTHSIFDFCPKCEYPVSKRAPAYLDEIKKMPEVVEILQQMSEINRLHNDIASDAVNAPQWLTQLSNYEEQFNTEISVEEDSIKCASNFAFKSENKDVSENVNDLGKSNNSNDLSVIISNQQKELKIKIAELQKRAFSSNQEARAFTTCIAIAIPQLRETKIPGTTSLWQCNFAGLLHLNPSYCQCASMGGNWVGGDPEKVVFDTIYKNI